MYAFRPRWIPYDSIVIESHSGYISMQALHWLSRNDIPVFVMDYDGTIITSILPPTSIKADLRAAQFETAKDRERKFSIAHGLVEAKIVRSLQILDWIAERYEINREIKLTKYEATKLSNATTVAGLRAVEGRVALRYWEGFRKALPESIDFHHCQLSIPQR
jgi:CRISPR-associated protein Cas1